MARKKTNDIEKVNKKEESINIESLKKELNKYINDLVKKEFTVELERANKRLLREKNIKIITKNMIITVLLLIIVYLVYALNNLDYFDKFFVENTNNNKVTNKTSNTTYDNKEVSLDDLKKEYSYLLDNIYIDEESEYLKDYYEGNLTTELKNYLTLNTFDFKELSNDEDYNIIDEKTFKNKYKKLFASEYNNKSFKYNDNYIRYISKIDSYISDDIINKVNSNIKREIIAIDIDEVITITTVEGLVKDNILYNVINNEEIGKYNNNLLDYIDKLNIVKYIFDNDDKLINISK